MRTTGVLPAPPADTLPTLITVLSRCTCFNHPHANSCLFSASAAPYSGVSGSSHRRRIFIALRQPAGPTTRAEPAPFAPSLPPQLQTPLVRVAQVHARRHCPAGDLSKLPPVRP